MATIATTITPYYERGGIALYHGDSRTILPQLEGKYHLLLTDPPYGVSYQSGNRRTKGSYDKIIGDESQDLAYDILKKAIRRLHENRHIYVFGPFDLTDLGVGGLTELIWDKGKPGLGDLRNVWGREHEYIQFAVECSSAKNRAKGYGNGAARLRRGSVLNYARVEGTASKHPTQKPVPLLQELIESSTRVGERVLDPFAGVGSTLVAAYLEGRRAVGIELSETYCRIAAERLSTLPNMPAE